MEFQPKIKAITPGVISASLARSNRRQLIQTLGQLRDRDPCVTSGFILECVWRSDWVAFDEIDGRERLLAGFKDIPEPLPTLGSPTNYWRGAWIFEAQPRNKRCKTLKERRTNQESRHEDQPAVRLALSLPVRQCTSQQLMEALMLQSGRWNNFNSEIILAALYQNRHLWLNFMMLLLIGEDEDSNRLYSNLGYALRDLRYRWHADTLYVWSRDDDCVYPLVDFGKAWMADDVQVMEKRSLYLSSLGMEVATIRRQL